jgi:hypothetical protein
MPLQLQTPFRGRLERRLLPSVARWPDGGPDLPTQVILPPCAESPETLSLGRGPA